MSVLKLVEDKIITINDQLVLIDSDVASLYGIETKRVNEAVANNQDKFPDGYILIINQNEWDSLRSKISTLKNQGRGKHRKYPPKAFTEKGLYMLATILKSPKATETTIAIIETYSKIRELSRTVHELSDPKSDSKQKELMQKSGNLIAEILDDDLQTSETETTIELNFAVLKFKHTVKRTKNDE
jgi:hypothetical protein